MRLEDLMDNLKRFVERNPFSPNDRLKDGRNNHYGQFKTSNRNMEKGDSLLLAKRHNRDNSFKKKICVTVCSYPRHVRVSE